MFVILEAAQRCWCSVALPQADLSAPLPRWIDAFAFVSLVTVNVRRPAIDKLLRFRSRKRSQDHVLGDARSGLHHPCRIGCLSSTDYIHAVTTFSYEVSVITAFAPAM
jgi:hypothetical protein